ncbi:DoxX family protein [Sorangium sp. So ce1389]|uniref:DoxX family protein n=1 Tax=Sorangium sp. So ce1389 TaxID=3133336 RepID=UPI003F647B6C
MNMDRMLSFLLPRALDRSTAAGLLFVRLVAGTAMALHGAPKMMAATSWMGPGPVPGWLQALAAFAEFGGGIAWILGLATPLASFGIAATMIVGIVIVHIPMDDPFIRLTVQGVDTGPGAPFGGLPAWFVRAGGRSPGGSGSSELASLFTAIAVLLLGAGPGQLSLDALLARRFTRRSSAERDAEHTGKAALVR